MKDFKLSILIGAVDGYSKTAKKVGASSEKMASCITSSQKAMHKLGQQGKAIERMRALETCLAKTSTEFVKAKQRTADLGKELAATDKPTKKLTQQFEAAKKASQTLRDRHQKQKEELRNMRTELRGAGVDTRHLADAQEAVTRKLEAGTRKMKEMARVTDDLMKSRARMDKTLQRAANVSLVAGGMSSVGQSALGAVSDPMQRMRGIERSRGELASLGVKDLDAVTKAAMDATRNLAGIDTAAFVSAAYDIKSGIASLSDQGVAAMTGNAAWTAKATKADVGQMTSLFATAYGSFKENLYAGATDAQFGDIFSATLSKSVQQFKTDGSSMQQAIQSMGSGLAASGISLSSQMTALGMLQQKMEAGVAGTTMNALERSAAQAQGKFEELGIDIQTLDANGNMRDLPDLLSQAREVFGDNYTSEIGSKLQKAFGSDEAVKFFKAMWGQEDAFRANRTELEKAQAQGATFTRQMAKVMDNNMDARMMLMDQRWGLIKARVGNALIPALDRLLPMLEKAAGWVENFVANHSGVSTALVGIVGGVGLIATVAAPVITAIAALTTAVAALGYYSKKAKAEMAMDGLGDDEGGGGGRDRKRRKRRKRRRRGGKKGFFKRIGRLGKRSLASTKGGVGKFGKVLRLGKGMGRKLGVAGAVATGALSIGSTLMDNKKSAGAKAATVTRDVGGIGGGMAGAMGGAALGTMILPGIGTAIGGLIGGIAGGASGDWLGGLIGGVFERDKDKAEGPMMASTKKRTAAVAGAGMMMAAPAMGAVPDLGAIPTLAPQSGVTRIDKSKREYNMTFQQAPGEDPEAMTRRVMAEIKRIESEERQGALYDIE